MMSTEVSRRKPGGSVQNYQAQAEGGKNLKIKSIKTVAGKSVMISLENKEEAEKMQKLIAEEIPKYKTQLGKRLNPRIRIHRLSDDPLDPRTKANIVDEFIENNFPDCADCERAEVKLVKQFDTVELWLL